MKTHELDMEIAADGTARMNIRGTSGVACEKHIEWVTGFLGAYATIDRKGDYYEQPTGVAANCGVRK